MLKEFFKPISKLTKPINPKADRVPEESLDNEITIKHLEAYFKRFPQREAIIVVDESDEPKGVIERKEVNDVIEYGVPSKGLTFSGSTLHGELSPDTMLPKFRCPKCGYEEVVILYNRKSPAPKCPTHNIEMTKCD